MSCLWKLFPDEMFHHKTSAKKAPNLFWFQVWDLNISDIFYKILNFVYLLIWYSLEYFRSRRKDIEHFGSQICITKIPHTGRETQNLLACANGSTKKRYKNGIFFTMFLFVETSALKDNFFVNFFANIYVDRKLFWLDNFFIANKNG